MNSSRRSFIRTGLFAVATAGSGATLRVFGEAAQRQPFSWRDAANRVTVEHAAISDSGDRFALQVTRALSARAGGFHGPAWMSLFDPRSELWLLDNVLGDPSRLPLLPGGAWAPCFSPSGRYLAALTMMHPGRVAIAVWDFRTGEHKTFGGLNVELFLAKFRNDRSAYGAPTDFFEVPRQYLWLDDDSLLFVDHDASMPYWVLAVSGLSDAVGRKRKRTEAGWPSVRVWDENSPTCGAGSRLVRMWCATGRVETLCSGDIRGVSLSPNRRWVAMVVARRNLPPVPNRGMQWPLLATTGFDDPLVDLKLAMLDLMSKGRVEEYDQVRGVGNVAPSRLPRWSPDSSRVAIPFRTSYSDAPATGTDIVWVVNPETGVHKKWMACSALDAELLAAMLASDGLNSKSVVEARPRKVLSRDYMIGGQVKGGAWRCADDQVLFWAAPSLTVISPRGLVRLPGRFTSVQPSVRGDAVARTLALGVAGEAAIITTGRTGLGIERVAASKEAALLAIRARDSALVYSEDTETGTFLSLVRPGRRTRRSSLAFNTYFRGIIRPERRMLVHRFPDGSVRTGLLQLPVGHLKGQRHPVIVWAYPDSQPSLNDSFSLANSPINALYPVQYLLTKGFAFFQAPLPLSRALSAQPMRATVEAVVPWLDVLDRQSEIVPKASGFFGFSNAGYVALALEALTHCFRGIVAWDTFPEIGYDTLHSDAGTVALNCGGGVIQSGRSFYEGRKQPYSPRPVPPWKNAVKYIRNDPLFNLSRASTPLLLIEGEFDTDPREMEEVYSILYGRGVPVELAYYWGENHVFSTPGNIHDCWERIERFFTRYVGLS